MNIETILNGIRYRSLFDKLSDEFTRGSTINDKLIVLAALNSWNLFDQIIKDYQQKYKQPKDKYILDQLTPTLQFFISHLQFCENLPLKHFKTQSLKQAIIELKTELSEKIQSQYSLSLLIESFLNEDETVFKNQNKFFKIDFHKVLTNKLKERDLMENKPYNESYTHVYNFLTYSLIPDFKKEKFHDYPIDMGMDYQTEYLVRFYLNNPSKENYLRAIEYAVNIIYLDKKPYHDFFVFRVNFSEKEITEDLYTKNHVGIRFDTNADWEDWEKLKNGQQPKQQFAQRWKQLNEAVKENDIIVIASYKNYGNKVGKISKGTTFEKHGKTNEFYTVFSLDDVQKIDKDVYPFLQTVLPFPSSISLIKRKNYTLRKKIFPNVIVPIQNMEFDDITL